MNLNVGQFACYILSFFKFLNAFTLSLFIVESRINRRPLYRCHFTAYTYNILEPAQHPISNYRPTTGNSICYNARLENASRGCFKLAHKNLYHNDCVGLERKQE